MPHAPSPTTPEFRRGADRPSPLRDLLRTLARPFVLAWFLLRGAVRCLAEQLRNRNVRLGFVLVMLTGFFGVVGARLASVQLGAAGDLADHAAGSTVVTNAIPASRGGIYDRNGRSHPFAESYPVWSLAIDPLAPRSEEERAAAGARLLAWRVFDEATVLRALASTNVPVLLRDGTPALDAQGRPRLRRWFPIGTTADRALAEDIATNPVLRCVTRERRTRRSYPMGRSLCQVVGAVNSHEEPLAGLEKTFDAQLRGTPGYTVGDATATRREIRSRRRDHVPALDGCDLFLTIDAQLQYAVDCALDEVMEEKRPRAAWAVVLDCRNGEILAMSSRPDFDPSDFGASTPEAQCNRVISTLYEPGSVMKTFAAAAALDEGLVHTNTLLDVSNTLYCGRPLRDHTHGQDRLTVAQMLAWSSNRGASRLGMALGKARQQRHLKAFGFGSKTRIPLLGEQAGRTIGDGSELNNIRISMGQGMTATALQLACAYAAIANGGRLLRPILVREIVAPDGTTVLRAEPEVVGRPVTERTARQIVQMLRAVVSRDGTARRAQVPGYTVAGKTGTAQMVVDRHYSSTDFRGSFIGIFPATDPRLVILVTCEATPKPNTDGGVCAAPVFARIAAEAARILRIPPDAEEPSGPAF